MPLVEVIQNEKTSDATVARTIELLAAAGKTPVHVRRDIPGFIGNRLAWEASDIFAAISAGAGTIGQNVEDRFVPKGPVSILEFHGTEDMTVPFDGGPVAAQGGTAISARKMIELWAKANGCPAKADVAPGAKVTRESYGPCRAGTEVACAFATCHPGTIIWAAIATESPRRWRRT